MKYLVLLLPFLLFFSLLASESDSEESGTLTISSRHMSDHPDETAQRVLLFLFGERPSDDIEKAFTKRLQASVHVDPSMRQIVKVIESSSSSDSPGEDPMAEIKKLMLEAVQEAVEEKHLQAADAQMQLGIREEELRVQKYKFYAAAATALTSMGGVITAFLAYNLS